MERNNEINALQLKIDQKESELGSKEADFH